MGFKVGSPMKRSSRALPFAEYLLAAVAILGRARRVAECLARAAQIDG